MRIVKTGINCIIINDNMLISYETHVASVVNKKIVRHWDGYSMSTLKHINMFLDYNGIEKINKKIWESMPIVQAVVSVELKAAS